MEEPELSNARKDTSKITKPDGSKTLLHLPLLKNTNQNLLTYLDLCRSSLDLWWSTLDLHRSKQKFIIQWMGYFIIVKSIWLKKGPILGQTMHLDLSVASDVPNQHFTSTWLDPCRSNLDPHRSMLDLHRSSLVSTLDLCRSNLDLHRSKLKHGNIEYG